jgi:glucose/arabinose dehydrogenase
MKARNAALIIAVTLVIALLIGVSALQTTLNTPTQQLTHPYGVMLAFPHLQFNKPVGIYSAGDSRLFVVEQGGAIKVFENNKNASTATVYLNLSAKVVSGGEMGLLGLAFDPHFSENGYFYVYYTADNPLRSVVSRFSVSPSIASHADANSEKIVLQVPQPYTNHKGGQLAFGRDGYLYIGLGDGGGEGDPLGNGQNTSTLLGKTLRIDVNSKSSGLSYSIPRDNPFVNKSGYRPEIYAYGLRNPWRFSFDRVTGQLWVGDVGQDRIEEIDIVHSGKNYGWNIMEGSLCYSPPSGCNQTGLELPIWEYNHSVGNAIIGGFVYRGAAFPNLAGAYIYGDYGSGRIWALHNSTTMPVNTELALTGLHISAFGTDMHNELLICALDGNLYKLQRAAGAMN